ncbi:hypothetical protein PHET_07966 [Paragonimus heterotremus]|uniref:Uncharacterized protein n=1 Tax=Paragonimus heterotremus TaxID=100268 RepID=A0A8J4SMM2_9TREM|nr:hypothetical protein PHET_07966 [Paragonimus heterotremus]
MKTLLQICFDLSPAVVNCSMFSRVFVSILSTSGCVGGHCEIPIGRLICVIPRDCYPYPLFRSRLQALRESFPRKSVSYVIGFRQTHC